jgi:DNA mismatch endonuclease (patch repair protein)
MADVFTKAKRSAIMARIRSRGNRDTELALAKLLRAHRITGWRRQVALRVTSDEWRVTRKARAFVLSPVTRHRSLTVRPDFVFAKSRMVIFVDGCFWHGCPKHATWPKNNRAFWRKKLAGNTARDLRVNRALRRAGWRVVRIWEHELQRGEVRRAKGEPSRLVARVRRFLAPK